MFRMLPRSNRRSQAYSAAGVPRKRGVANTFLTEVEKVCGSTIDPACNTETKLVDTKLEMVRAAGLFHCTAAVRRIRWINSGDRLQRDEIHRCLQRSVGASKGGSRCNRGARFTDKGGIPRLRKLKRQRRIR